MNALLIILPLLLPLVGGLLSVIFRKSNLAILAMAISFVSSGMALIVKVNFQFSHEWLPGYFISILIDNTTLILMCLVVLISLLVHIFSLEYMREDAGKHRYFAKLGFFTFSMLGLLMADHLILLFVFWELVGLASYLLIGFWYRKDGVPASARLAFMVNRVADVALLAGILILNNSGMVQISTMQSSWMLLPSLLIALGAFGKSAQLPFSGWLTKAMVGPTPVSALIHAATMVAAGVYLLFRVAPFLHHQALLLIAFTGVVTALYGGLSALFQHDIKKVLAYSTISQLGYMVMGIGVGGESASLFHLFTHAFFKAGLFLGAGAIIHFMHQAIDGDAQDMRNMGGIRKKLPWTFRTFLICSLALAGLPFFSGFMSKEAIIISAWNWAGELGTWAYFIPDLGLVTAFITALYVGRMVLLVFFGEARVNLAIDFKERFALRIPLLVLAVGSFWVFYQWNPLAHESWLSGLWSGQVHGEGSLVITFLSILLVLAGLVLAYGLFKPNTPYQLNYAKHESRFAIAMSGFYLVNFYEIFGKLFTRVARWLHDVDRRVIDEALHFLGVGTVVFSKTIALIDRFLVDGPVNGIAALSAYVGRRLAGLSSRDAQTQLAWLLVGLLLILSWILFF